MITDRWVADRARHTGLAERKNRAGGDGEIKGPGPFRSVALMVLKNFRDLDFDPGPGFQGFPHDIKGLSGTNAEVWTR